MAKEIEKIEEEIKEEKLEIPVPKPTELGGEELGKNIDAPWTFDYTNKRVRVVPTVQTYGVDITQSKTKGDLTVGDGSYSQKLGVGSNDQVLTAASGETLGMKWATITTVPSGAIMIWGTGTAPTGYLLCDGTAVSRTTYATLFALIGTTYGSGDGSTTFNVPNLKGKVPAGFNSAETEFDALGEIGGEKTHALTEAELATHSHNIDRYNAGTFANRVGSGDNSTGATAVATSTTGSGTAHQNLQPYITLNFIIKT